MCGQRSYIVLRQNLAASETAYARCPEIYKDRFADILQSMRNMNLTSASATTRGEATGQLGISELASSLPYATKKTGETQADSLVPIRSTRFLVGDKDRHHTH